MTSLGTLIIRAASSISDPSSTQAEIISKLISLQTRLQEGVLRVAVLGQFKRGKSTLLNALLGAPLLPAGVIPVTAIPTFIGSGTQPRARISFTSGEEVLQICGQGDIMRALDRYISEEQNPHNRLNVEKVEIEFPSDFLKHGIVMIDTPGVGSTFLHNTRTAEAVLSECDAALFVISADPPITEVEVNYLRDVQKLVPKIFFVLNKKDLLDANERKAAERFLVDVLKQQPGFGQRVALFSVSGKAGLQAKQDNDSCALAESGIHRLEEVLAEELAREKREIVFKAGRLRAISLVSQLRFQSELERRALLMPQEELRNKARIFEESVARFESERQALSDFVSIDRNHLLKELDEEIELLWKKAQTETREILEAIAVERVRAKAASDRLAAALSQRFEQAFPQFVAEFRRKLNERLAVHRGRADALISLVRQTAANLMDISMSLPPADEAFEMKRDPYWVAPESPLSLLDLSTGVITHFLPESMRERRLIRKLKGDAERAILRNVANLDWAMRQNIEEAFRNFEADLAEQLDNALQVTREVLRLALDRHAAASEEGAVYIGGAERSVLALTQILTELENQAIAVRERPSPAA